MDPRQELYAALVEQLKNIPEVKHVDLWNENVVYADQDEPWQRPSPVAQNPQWCIAGNLAAADRQPERHGL